MRGSNANRELVKEVARALVSGVLDKKGAVLAALYLAYATSGKPMDRDGVVELLRRYNYDFDEKTFYSYASKLREDGLIKSIRVRSSPRGKRVVYTVNDDNLTKVERELKRKVSEALGDTSVVKDEVEVATPEEVEEKVFDVLAGGRRWG